MKKTTFFISALFLCNFLFCAVQNEKLKLNLTEQAQELLAQAEQYELEGKLKKAAKLYHKAGNSTDLRMAKAAIYLEEAQCWQQARKSQKALESYQQVLKMYPLYVPYEKVVPQLRNLAQAFIDGNGTFLGLRDRDAAVDIYKLIILETPATSTSIDDRIHLANIYLEDGKKEEAINTYAELLKQYPAEDNARLDMAQLIMELARQSDGDGSRLRAAVKVMETAADYAQPPAMPESH